MTFIKEILSWLFAERGTDLGLLLLRIVAGGFMLPHGVMKWRNFSTLSASFSDPIGLGSKWSLILIIFAEVGCAIAVILGLFTRLAVLPLIFGMAVAAGSHPQFKFSKSELALLFLAVYVALFIMGGGAFSIDHLLANWLL